MMKIVKRFEHNRFAWIAVLQATQPTSKQSNLIWALLNFMNSILLATVDCSSKPCCIHVYFVNHICSNIQHYNILTYLYLLDKCYRYREREILFPFLSISYIKFNPSDPLFLLKFNVISLYGISLANALASSYSRRSTIFNTLLCRYTRLPIKTYFHSEYCFRCVLVSSKLCWKSFDFRYLILIFIIYTITYYHYLYINLFIRFYIAKYNKQSKASHVIEYSTWYIWIFFLPSQNLVYDDGKCMIGSTLSHKEKRVQNAD